MSIVNYNVNDNVIYIVTFIVIYTVIYIVTFIVIYTVIYIINYIVNCNVNFYNVNYISIIPELRNFKGLQQC